MKTMYALLIGIALFSFAGTAQAQDSDPYSGTYICSGEPQMGCGSGEECSSIEIYPPSSVTVKKIGGSYQICPQYDTDTLGIRSGNGDCVDVEIKNGVAHWSGTTKGMGVTFSGEVTATFDGSTINAEEKGRVRGACNCDLSLKAICTK